MSKKRNTGPLPLLIIAVSSVLLITVGIVLAGDFGSSDNKQGDPPIADNPVEPEVPGSGSGDIDEQDEDRAQKPPSANVLLIGFDKTMGLTDVVMVAHLDTDTNEVKLINLPRDMKIDFTQEGFKEIKKENNLRIRYCKLTDFYSLAGWNDDALLMLRDIAEEITGLSIDYTTAINIDGFRDVVNAVGGVEFYVPEDMYYNDDHQDLHINLKEGLQLLDGDKAEQLVRNRKFKKSSPPPDYQRIAIQQDFLIAMSNKILKIRDISKIKALASTAYDLVKTDFGALVMAEYVDYLFKQDLPEILNKDNMVILPSYGKKIDGSWYQVWKASEVKETIDKLLNSDMLSDTEKDQEESTSSKIS